MKKVRRALITAAGLGSRMFPYTKHMNKLMIPIVNKPMVHYLVKELVDSDIKEIIISGRYLEPVKEYFKHNSKLLEETKQIGQKGSLENLKKSEFKCKITYVEQKHPKGWMYEVYRSRKLLKNAPFAVVMSDIVYFSEKPAIHQLIKRHDETGLNIHGNCRYVFNSKLLEILDYIKFEKGDDTHAVSLAFKEMSDKGELINLSIKGEWFDVGTPIGYLKAQTYYGINHKKYSKEYKEFMKRYLENDL